ncbi:MAG: hypothetical protein JOY85_08120 [Acidobacteriaceae bacterium]|nr:hypothetical protein [Acidobacteriaceae bacterium]
MLVGLAAWWFYRQGFILYYGDAQAHLNISRSIIDSRTPGYDQLGTVWLPVLHVICLPLVRYDWLWSTGLAATIPVGICFVIAGMFLYLAARDAYGNSVAAAVVVACLALNPNILYLAVIPMTEMVFIAGLAVLLFAACRFQITYNRGLILLGVFASWWMSLTRYDGWFLIPFASGWFAWSARDKRLLTFAVFAALASLAPLYWAAHNWWETGNALDFFNGPYSPKAIQGGQPYPGYHNWKLALTYYGKASQLCAGWPLLLVGLVGIVCALRTKALTPVAFLALTPAFYVWSMHSSGGSPIHVPQLWPFTYYNTRYGIAVVVWAAFATGAVAIVIPQRWKRFAAVLPIITALPWLLMPSRENWICWKESEVNSVARRAWTAVAADDLQAHYRRGQGIIAPFSDLTGIFCKARIPLREVLHEGNGPEWLATTTRPDLLHREMWVIVQENNNFLEKPLPGERQAPYGLVHEIQVKDAPVVEIYRRVE